MKSLVLVAALLLPSVGFAATLSGTITNDASAVTLSTTGTAGWARWPGYLKKNTLISNVTNNKAIKVYSNDKRVVDGSRTGIKTGGKGAYFQFTASATTTERVLMFYISGWNSSGRVTASLPGAKSYTTSFSSSSTYNRVVTIRYKADSNGVMTVRYDMTAGSGSINMEAVALQNAGTSTPPPSSGNATLTWNAPTTNTNGTKLTDLTGFKVYWGKTRGSYTNSFRINNLLARDYTISGLTSGTWYFTVTAINAAQAESGYSNVASKTIK
jgi:hypothetical protein